MFYLFSSSTLLYKHLDNKIFYDLFCLINTIIIFIMYAVDRQYVIYYTLITASITLLVTNQVRYILPFIFMFTITVSASITNIVFTLFCLLFFIITIVIYFIYNKPKIKIKKHGIVMFFLSISTFIPIFWYEEVPLLHDVYIFTYLFYIIIFILYIFLKSSKEKLLPSFIISVSYIPLLLMLELVFYYITVPNTNFQGGIFLGWAGGNHASMLVLFTFPIVMYRLYIQKNKLIPIILALSSVIAILFGFSRAGYIFFILELVVFTIFSLFHYKEKKIIKNTFSYLKRNYVIVCICITILFIILLFLLCNIENIDSIIYTIFNDNGRIEVYIKGINLFLENTRNFIFGRGFVTQYILYEGVFLLFHNTFIQAITTGGIIMLCLFIIHFFQKYSFFKKRNNLFISILLISFIITDLYGLTDSTYFTSYFTVILTTILVCFENEEEYFENIDDEFYRSKAIN